MTIGALILIALASLCLLFGLVYRYARHLNNYGIVDVAWAYAFSALALFYAATASGWGPRRAVIAGLVTIWSVRLGTHLFRRVKRHHPVEDVRYRQLRENWGATFGGKMAAFFQLQAISVVLLGTPILLACIASGEAFGPLDIAGASLWVVAILGEATADFQLSRFSRDSANKGKVCDVGLWHYSRHPNYFFDWLIWVSFFLLGLSAPWGWAGAIAPGTILFLLVRVTGIPMAEVQSLKSRGDAYRRYQASTSAFIPWFPKKPLAPQKSPAR